MRRLLTLVFLVTTLILVAASCGGNPTSTTGASTTEAGTTTVASTTTTTSLDRVFTRDDLAGVVLQDGDPWTVPVVGAESFEITIDDVVPVDAFPDERAAYEAAGFDTGWLSFFEEEDGLLITAAHLFETAAGAEAVMPVFEGWLNDIELVERITSLTPGSLTSVAPIGIPDLGDLTLGVILTGPEVQVIGVVWTNGNMVQFVRAGMSLGDTDREAAALAVAAAMAGRAG